MIYAVGDVHGEIDLLEKLLKEIASDAPKGEDNILIFIGDYVDRGPDSRAVIDMLMRGIDGFETICLKGNHEVIFVDFVTDPQARPGSTWFRDMNGGRETIASYGIDPDAVIDVVDDQDKVAELLSPIPSDHIAWMDDLPVSYRHNGYFFVHAGVRPGVPLEHQSEDDMMWIRDRFLKSRKNHGALVIHGHTPKRSAEIRKNRINIDTGACYWGELTAVALSEEEEPRFLSVM